MLPILMRLQRLLNWMNSLPLFDLEIGIKIKPEDLIAKELSAPDWDAELPCH